MLFKLTMPADARLAPAVRQLAERVAQCAGYTAADAARFASGVGRVVEMVLARPATAAPNDLLDIRFVRDGVYLDVWLRYRADAYDRPALDPVLSSEALRQGIDSADFGLEGDLAYCRLRRVLPREKVDHQCEVPPDAK